MRAVHGRFCRRVRMRCAVPVVWHVRCAKVQIEGLQRVFPIRTRESSSLGEDEVRDACYWHVRCTLRVAL